MTLLTVFLLTMAMQAVMMLAAAHTRPQASVGGAGGGGDAAAPLPMLLRFVLPGEEEAQAFATLARSKLGPPNGVPSGAADGAAGVAAGGDKVDH